MAKGPTKKAAALAYKMERGAERSAIGPSPTKKVAAAMNRRVGKFMQRLSATKPCPKIRWQDVVRIEAMGTDAFSAFQIWLTFTHSDRSVAQVAIETRGYWDIVASLHGRFPSISPNWYDEMSEQQWHVERVLYLRDGCVLEPAHCEPT